MNVTVSGATGRVGRHLVAALKARGDDVVALSRDPDKAGEQLGVKAYAWDLKNDAVPKEALLGRDAVVHLAGEDVGQRWTTAVKEEIRASRELGTRNLVAGIAAADPRPPVLVSASASGFYGPHGAELVDESSPAGRDWLADVCVRWEKEADAAAGLDVRVVKVRTGIVLDAEGGALAQMLTPFRLGVGGPVAGGRQYLPWIHLDDIAGIYLAALDHERLSGPVNASAPAPATNRDFSRALGRALHRPAIAPVPGFAVKLLFGEMSQLVVGGVRMVPGRAAELGYVFAHPELDGALADTLS
ncbi:MAG: TIGR01777 family protein [Solirubrobacterales bacterium]|nr:TIGR01777 family protein [Solirubrobacterales bacterium]